MQQLFGLVCFFGYKEWVAKDITIYNLSVQSLVSYQKEKTMEPCYVYLGCGEKDCPMHGRKDTKRCWEVEGTLCNHHGIQIIRDKLAGKKENACNRSGCIYFKTAKDRGIV
jgi:hypothetical protein